MTYDRKHVHKTPLRKSELVNHVRQPHEGIDGRVRQSAELASYLTGFSKDELEVMHAELHGNGTTPNWEAIGYARS